MSGQLDRRLGLPGSIAIGTSAMIGAGLFVVLGPAVAAAGGAGVLLALALAAVIAACNAHSSARLAQLHPTAGGTYVYGRERLGPFWGHLAGWAFIVGKLSSCAVMALAVGAYAWPEQQRLVAVVATIAVAGLNLCGIQKSAVAGIVVVTVVLVVVLGVVVTLLSAPGDSSPVAVARSQGVLEAAGLLFFAFAGYARLATLAEEVRDPVRTIPLAIAITVAVVVGVYLASTLALVHVLGQVGLADSPRPFVTALQAADVDGLVPLVVAAAALAAGGALLSLMLGISRTALAMARDGHLPRQLARVDPQRRVPFVAELAVAVVVCGIVVLGDIATSVAFSSFCVLAYYAIANASALTLDSSVVARCTAWVGLGGCVLLAVYLPLPAVVGGGAALVAGAASFRVRAGTWT